MDVQALAVAAGFGAEGLDVTVSGRPRGVTVHALSSDPGLLDDLVTQYLEMHRVSFGPTARRDISALWLLQDVSWLYAALTVGLIPAHRMSLALSDDTIGMHLPRDYAFAVELDQASLAPRVATTAAEAAELYVAGREHLAATLGDFVAALRPHLRTGPRAAWACVTDMATGAISTGAARFGGSDRVRQELGAFMRADLPGPLLTGARMVSSPAGPIRMRKGCCLLYAIEGMDVCFSCPRLRPSG